MKNEVLEKFYIGAYWGPRKEHVSLVAEKVLDFVRKLQVIHPQFANLYELGNNRKSALDKKVTVEYSFFEKSLNKNKKNIIDGYSELGFTEFFWTGHDDEFSSQVKFSVGKSSPRLSNYCIVGIPLEGMAREDILSLDKVKEITRLLVDVWEPDRVALMSNRLCEAADIPSNNCGWVSYKAGAKPMCIQEIDGIRVWDEQYSNGRIFIVEPPFDSQDERRINAVKYILKHFLNG